MAAKIHKYLSITGLCIAVALSPFNAVADPEQCSNEESQAAENVANKAKSWDELHQQYRRYSHCDDGAIGQGFSESVTALLSRKWETVGALNRLAASDRSFEKFVVRHIDETVPAERLMQISANARAKCPNKMYRLCAAIADSATTAVARTK